MCHKACLDYQHYIDKGSIMKYPIHIVQALDHQICLEVERRAQFPLERDCIHGDTFKVHPDHSLELIALYNAVTDEVMAQYQKHMERRLTITAKD